MLHLAHSKIYISCDLQALPNYYDILRVIAYFLSEDGVYIVILIALKELLEGAGYNRALIIETLYKVINNQGITLKLRYFIIDNVSNNNIIIRHLLIYKPLYYRLSILLIANIYNTSQPVRYQIRRYIITSLLLGLYPQSYL